MQQITEQDELFIDTILEKTKIGDYKWETDKNDKDKFKLSVRTKNNYLIFLVFEENYFRLSISKNMDTFKSIRCSNKEISRKIYNEFSKVSGLVWNKEVDIKKKLIDEFLNTEGRKFVRRSKLNKVLNNIEKTEPDPRPTLKPETLKSQDNSGFFRKIFNRWMGKK
jgi:hypothetical protein